ncbi:hypothetical protein [Halomonas sp. C05BenzN]|uniref:hypothetical protein n=1 Tax=Halomonas sp. C05BenzN TaxID=3411041 RepID=UPI003B938EBD
MIDWLSPIRLTGTGDEEGAFDNAMTETEIAAVADQWLRQHHWETYPEVVIETFPGRPDIIATRASICQVIECKRSLTLGVVEQASRWHWHSRPEQSGMPHLIWIVVQRSRGRRNELLCHLIREFGLGLMTIEKTPALRFRYSDEEEVRPQEYRLHQEICPRLQPGSRRAAKTLMAHLNPDMRIATPGARGGETTFMTPFKRTMAAIEQLMADGKEHHIDHILEWLNTRGGHHYATDRSAKSALPAHLDRLGYRRTRDYGPWFASPETKKEALV